MPKGLFSQGFCLLTDGGTTIEEIKVALAKHGYTVVKDIPAQECWSFSGPALIIPYLPEVHGQVSIDVVNHPWPDTMGDPKSDPMTFGAWSMGHFGPFAFPGGLERAQQHAWAWPEARAVAGSHRGFIRLRISYVFGRGDEAPLLPKNYDPLGELGALSVIALALLEVPGVICYFNPNGEVLRDRAGFGQIWSACAEQQKLPLPLWMNIRFFNLNEEFALMDTVGNAQLDIGDIEAIFSKSSYDPRDVDYYLRNVTHYLLETDREIQSGEAFDGPGESDLGWMVDVREDGLVQPPRDLLRLFRKSCRGDVESAIAAIAREA